MWSKAIYLATQQNTFSRDRRLVTQINDSSASVMANIAEGFGRGTQGEFVQFLGYSIGSLDETRSHLTVAYDRGYLLRDSYGSLFSEGTTIRKMTVAFLGSMVMSGSGVKHLREPTDWSERVWPTYERYTGKSRPELFRKAADDKHRQVELANRIRRQRRQDRADSLRQHRNDAPPTDLP